MHHNHNHNHHNHMMGGLGFGGMSMSMIFGNEQQEWQIEFDTKPQKLAFGPFGRNEIQFYYKDRQYSEIFGKGLEECKGTIKMKRITDRKWTNLDEIGLCLLMKNLNGNINISLNGIDAYVELLYERNRGLWVFRYGSFGSKVHGTNSVIEMKSVEFRKTKNINGIFIKRVGENGWYESNDIDLHILFYHLNIHKNYIVPMGINNIHQAINRAHQQKLEPHFVYNEWNIIKLLMKAMRIDQYFDELHKYCQEQEFEDIECILDDLEEFIISGDGDGSMIIDHFRYEYDYISTCTEEENDEKEDGYYQDTNDNDTKGIRKEKWIKLGFIVYQAIKLLPVFKIWCDILCKNYLEKHFSYARCNDHKYDYCCYIERLIPMAQYIHIWNRDICYISGQINETSPYWITQKAFLYVLPHYNYKRLRADYEHLQNIIMDAMTDCGVLRDLVCEDDDINHTRDDLLFSRSDTLKIFHFFDKHLSDIQCQIQDCHTTNRKCFSVKSHPPYPFPFHWKRKSERTRKECDATRTLDELHHLLHHSDYKYKYMKIESDPIVQNMKQFQEIKRAANKKYYMKQPPKLYYFEDNEVGIKSIEDVTDLTPNRRA